VQPLELQYGYFSGLRTREIACAKARVNLFELLEIMDHDLASRKRCGNASSFELSECSCASSTRCHSALSPAVSRLVPLLALSLQLGRKDEMDG